VARTKAVAVILAMSLGMALAQMTWTCATESAPWAPRTDHASVVFDGKMWVIGGFKTYPGEPMNDVWYSTNGADWELATDSAPWSARAGHRVVVFRDTMWLTGGDDDGAMPLFDDVWFSADGVNWTCATDSAPWAARLEHGVLAFNNKMWVIGGIIGSTSIDDVWCSVDGVNWTCVTDSAPWQGRCNHAVAIFNNLMWVLGGEKQSGLVHDVWYSTDGDSWVCATTAAPWCARGSHGVAVLDSKMWVTGGYPTYSTRLNDVWYSAGGADWTCADWTRADSAAEWRPRGWHTSLTFDDKVWVIGGDSTYNSLAISDVWYSTGLGIEETPNAGLRAASSTATIVRGVLFRQEALSHKLQATGLLDIAGRQVMVLRPGRNDVSGLAPGVYFIQEQNLRGHGVEGSRVGKIIVTR